MPPSFQPFQAYCPIGEQTGHSIATCFLRVISRNFALSQLGKILLSHNKILYFLGRFRTWNLSSEICFLFLKANYGFRSSNWLYSTRRYFFHFRLDCTFNDQNIVVMEEVTIKPPYKP